MCLDSCLRAFAGSRFAYIPWLIIMGIFWATGCGMGGDSDLIDPDDNGTFDSTVVPDDASTDPELLDPAEVVAPQHTLSFSAGPVFCCNPLSIEFSAEATNPYNSSVPTFAWDYGDGISAVGKDVVHTYRWFGEYMVVLTAHWPGGVTGTTRQVLSLAQDEYFRTEVVVTPPAPVLPVAEAGLNQSVLMGDTVVLDGSGSTSATGQELVYEWVQTGGPVVVLDPADQAVVSFTAPQIEGERDILEFVLSVTENDLQDSDEVLVEVLSEVFIAEMNTPPTASDQSVSVVAGNAAVLTLVANDADGDDLTFSIVDGPEHGTLGAVDNSSLSTATVDYSPEPGITGADSFTFQVSDGQAESAIATFTLLPCETLKIIPWVELNYSAFDEQGIEGLLIWQEVTDTAIVSTIPGRDALYTKLQNRVPGMRIIPGLKTMHLLDRFDSVEGWQAISQEVSAIRQTSGESVILLENEVAIEAWVMGTEILDLNRLREGLALLPGDTEYIWRPSVYWFIAGDEGHQRLAEVCRVAEEVLPNVRFQSQRYIARDTVQSQRYANAEDLLNSIASKPTLPKLFFYGPDYDLVWWMDSELLEALSYIREDWGPYADVMIYAGLEHWVEAARSLSGQLVPSCSLQRP